MISKKFLKNVIFCYDNLKNKNKTKLTVNRRSCKELLFCEHRILQNIEFSNLLIVKIWQSPRPIFLSYLLIILRNAKMMHIVFWHLVVIQYCRLPYLSWYVCLASKILLNVMEALLVDYAKNVYDEKIKLR